MLAKSLQVYSCSEYNEVVNKRAAILILQVMSISVSVVSVQIWKEWLGSLIRHILKAIPHCNAFDFCVTLGV